MIWLAAALANPPTSTSTVSYPPGASGDVVCKLHIVTNGKEKPLGVLVSGCGPEFATMVRKAVVGYWRWEPDDPAHVEEWKINFFQSSPVAKSRQLGVLETPLADLVKVVHASSLTVKNQVIQKYPPGGDGKAESCKVEMWFESESGRIAQAKVDGCDTVFHDVSLTAAYAWSIEPAQAEQRWIRATFPFKFVEPDHIPFLKDWSDLLEMVEQVEAVVPGRSKKYRPATCEVAVTIGLDGLASKATEIKGCDGALHVAAENAVRRSRWRHLGEPTPRFIVVPVAFAGKKRKKR